MVEEDQIRRLTSAELNRSFSKGIKWLRGKVYDPLAPYKSYDFRNGSISVLNFDPLIYQVRRSLDDGSSERYVIREMEGLVSFIKDAIPTEVQSSILGTLNFERDDRYFVTHSRREETIVFGTSWLESESEINAHAKWAVEERKRAALRVIKACQSQT